MKLSGLVWLDDTTLLVLERTDDEARLYTIDLTGATNMLGTAWSAPVALPSLESQADPEAVGVTPVAKTLLVNLNDLPGMPGKIEGVAVIDDATVAAANDNDFNIDALYEDDAELKPKSGADRSAPVVINDTAHAFVARAALRDTSDGAAPSRPAGPAHEVGTLSREAPDL